MDPKHDIQDIPTDQQTTEPPLPAESAEAAPHEPPGAEKTVPTPEPAAVDPAAPAEPQQAPRKAKKPLPPWLRKLGKVALAGFVLALLGAAAFGGLILYYRQDLPEFTSLKDYKPSQTTKIVSTDGTVIGEIFDERRTVVPYGEIPKVMIQAITAAEDANFFEHSGVDYVGTLKAFVHDLIPGTQKRGGSTLTQQTVKTMLLTSERSVRRKIKEMILAQRLEQHLTKEEILHIYLNQIYFGHKRYGIEEASQFYFGHGARDLTLGEAAMLASVPKSPEKINPLTNPKRLKERQTYVLRRMVELGFIAQAVADREIARPVPMPPTRLEFSGAYYMDEVKRQLYAKFGEELVDGGGLRVETMMNPQLQADAEASVKQGLRDVDKRQGWRGATGRLDDALWQNIRTAAEARLKTVQEQGREGWGAVPVLDLRRLDTDALAEDHSPAKLAKAGKSALWKRGDVNSELVAYVGPVTKSTAEIELGIYTTTLSLPSVAWARKYNPTSMTALPRSMTDVLKPGDLVKVRITRVTPCDDAAQKKGTCKTAKIDVALEQDPLVEGALVTIDPETRGVLALVGGYEFDAKRSAFNRATQARRQPGSAFKPFVYAAALDVGQQRKLLLNRSEVQSEPKCILFTPRQQVSDAPEYVPDHWTGKPWIPHNFERDSFDGPMTVRHALAVSKNTVAVKLVEQIGCSLTENLSFDDKQSKGLALVKQTARRAGLDSPVPDTLTAVLGAGEVVPLELTNAYATFDAEGRFAPPVFIKRVMGPGGKVLFENHTTFEQQPPFSQDAPPATEATRGLRADVAYVTANVMRSVVEDPEGTAHSLMKLGRPIAGKTGTASEHRDGWFVGFTPELVTGVWVGFDDHSSLGPRETGGHCAGPIWLSFMKAAETTVPHRDFEMPPGVVAVDIDPRTGMLADPKSPYLEREVYLLGTEPTKQSEPDQVKPEDFMRGEIP
jgi:penicillin-binding protein 1A